MDNYSYLFDNNILDINFNLKLNNEDIEFCDNFININTNKSNLKQNNNTLKNKNKNINI